MRAGVDDVVVAADDIDVALLLLLVDVTHQHEGVLVFLPVLSALFNPVGDHFGPVALAVGLGPDLELALFVQRQFSPSLADDLAEFLELVLGFCLGRWLCCGCDAAAFLSKIEVVGGERAFGRYTADVNVLWICPRQPRSPLSFLFLGYRVVVDVGVVVNVDDRGSRGSGSSGDGIIRDAIALFCHPRGRIRVCIWNGGRFSYEDCAFILIVAVDVDKVFFFHQEFVDIK